MIQESTNSVPTANLYNITVTTKYNVVKTLLNYGFDLCTTNLLTNIDRKQVSKVRKDLIAKHLLIKEKKTKSTKNSFNQKNYSQRRGLSLYTITAFLLLYIRFHETNANDNVDVEAILKAWNLLINYDPVQIDNANINDAYMLARLLLRDTAYNTDSESIFISYSKKYKAFYTYQSSECYELNDTGYEELQDIKTISEMLKKQKSSNKSVKKIA